MNKQEALKKLRELRDDTLLDIDTTHNHPNHPFSSDYHLAYKVGRAQAFLTALRLIGEINNNEQNQTERPSCNGN